MKMDFEEWEAAYGPTVDEKKPIEEVVDVAASVVENDKIVETIEIPNFEVKFDIEVAPDTLLGDF